MIQIDFRDRLTAEQIVDALNQHETPRFQRNLDYYLGNNTAIMERKRKVKDAPNWIVAVPYGRKIIKTVVGYMYKPGLISYTSENERYLELLTEVFNKNKEATKTSLIGEQASVQGSGYEIHYTINDGAVVPYFSRIPATQGIPIYGFEIEPELKCFIYYYKRGDVQDIYVYYADVVELWKRSKNDIEKLPTFVEETPHEYENVPVVVYKNNEEMIGDYEPIIDLFDVYDSLMSDCMNEVDRFASAYMVLKGIGALDQEQKAALKELRTFEIDTEGAVDILTKDIPSDYFQFMTDWVRKEIHKQSHVPNFLEDTAGADGLSGVAIDKLLYDFEFIASTKQSLFEEGLEKRIELINTILRKANTGDVGSEWDIDIHFQRNKPANMKENAEIMNQLLGFVSKPTLVREYVPFVENAEEEVEKAEEERDLLGDIDAGTGDDRESDMEEPTEDRERGTPGG